MNNMTMTFIDPLSAVYRLPNGGWLTEISPGRLIVSRSKEEAIGVFLLDRFKTITGREYRDDDFRIWTTLGGAK